VALGHLKSPKSCRSIRLTRASADALRAQLQRQLEEMERMGSIYQPGGPVFATESGTLINPSNLRNRSFKPLLMRAFGQSGAMTLDTYSHFLPRMGDQTVRAMEAALSSSQPRCCTKAPDALRDLVMPLCFTCKLRDFWVGLPGLEPGTSSLSEKRSNRLSYRPVRDGGIHRRVNVQHGGVTDKLIEDRRGGQ
jgi:hypothetical protein